MGNENIIQNTEVETDNKSNSLILTDYKGPEFVLNEKYPNDEHFSLEQILKQH